MKKSEHDAEVSNAALPANPAEKVDFSRPYQIRKMGLGTLNYYSCALKSLIHILRWCQTS